MINISILTPVFNEEENTLDDFSNLDRIISSHSNYSNVNNRDCQTNYQNFENPEVLGQRNEQTGRFNT